MFTEYKLPERTIGEKSGLYRFQKFFYRNSLDPFDTCEFGARLLKIFLLWIPLILVFLVAPAVYFLINWFTTGRLMTAGQGPGFWNGACALGQTEVMVYAILFVLWVCFKIYKKSQVALKTLGIIALALAGLSALYFWILFFAGLSIFSGMTGSTLSLVVSIIGMVATFGGLVYLIVVGLMKWLDSNTYDTLETSAKERWCARLRIVGEDGKTRDERIEERLAASRNRGDEEEKSEPAVASAVVETMADKGEAHE